VAGVSIAPEELDHVELENRLLVTGSDGRDSRSTRHHHAR